MESRKTPETPPDVAASATSGILAKLGAEVDKTSSPKGSAQDQDREEKDTPVKKKQKKDKKSNYLPVVSTTKIKHEEVKGCVFWDMDDTIIDFDATTKALNAMILAKGGAKPGFAKEVVPCFKFHNIERLIASFKKAQATNHLNVCITSREWDKENPEKSYNSVQFIINYVIPHYCDGIQYFNKLIFTNGKAKVFDMYKIAGKYDLNAGDMVLVDDAKHQHDAALAEKVSAGDEEESEIALIKVKPGSDEHFDLLDQFLDLPKEKLPSEKLADVSPPLAPQSEPPPPPEKSLSPSHT